MLTAEHQSARMSKITNDCLTRFGTGRMLYSCTQMATVDIKGLTYFTFTAVSLTPFNVPEHRWLYVSKTMGCLDVNKD